MKKLTFHQQKLLTFYKENSHKFLPDTEVYEKIGIARNSVRAMRNKLAAMGYSFAYKTVLNKGNKISNHYKYIGKVDMGVVMVDDKKDPVDKRELERLLFRMMSDNTFKCMKFIIERNDRGYYTLEDIMIQTGLSLAQVESSIQSFKQSFGVEFHSRGAIKARQYRVIGVSGEKKSYSTAKVAKPAPNFNLLNSVFN